MLKVTGKEQMEVLIMPRKDGTGPLGKGPTTGKGGAGQGGGRGAGQDGGRGAGQGGSGMGRMGGSGTGRMGGSGTGTGGECQCPQCGTRAPHKRGMPCVEQKCPQCGSTMVRAS